MNNLMIFEEKEVEIFKVKGQVLFNPYHCGKCLDLGESAVRMAISKMNEKQVIKLTNLDVKDIDIRKLNNAGENFLTESGVYKLIFRSNKEEAEKFQDWVTDEVLPSIRKHGLYITDELLANQDLLEDKINELRYDYKRLKEEKAEVEKENQEFMLQRDTIFRLSVKTGQDESYIPDLALQVIREYVLNNEEVVIEIKESGYKVKKRPLMKELNKLILRKQDIIYVLGLLRVNIEEDYIFIRREFMDKDYKPIGSLYL